MGDTFLMTNLGHCLKICDPLPLPFTLNDNWWKKCSFIIPLMNPLIWLVGLVCFYLYWPSKHVHLCFSQCSNRWRMVVYFCNSIYGTVFLRIFDNISTKLCLLLNFVYCVKVLTFWQFPKLPKTFFLLLLLFLFFSIYFSVS